MFKGFNVKNVTFDDVSSMKEEYIRKNRIRLFSIKSDFVKPIESYLKEGMFFDGDALKQGWFPSKKRFDIFISHSGNDEDLAYAFAWRLQEDFNLSCFIDSFIWKHFSSLKRELDVFFEDKYQREYDSMFRDRVNQHVILMLNASLMEVMERSECLFFLNTPKSVEVSEIGNYHTDSPWLFSEIGMFNNIEKKRRKRTLFEARAVTATYSDIKYKLNLKGLINLGAKDLNNWVDEFSNSSKHIHPLDVLYDYCIRRKE